MDKRQGKFLLILIGIVTLISVYYLGLHKHPQAENVVTERNTNSDFSKGMPQKQDPSQTDNTSSCSTPAKQADKRTLFELGDYWRYADCKKFHLITMYFSVYTQPEYTAHFGNKSLDDRDKEYLEVLQSNLNHPCILRAHLFYVNDPDIKRVQSANFTNLSKLQPVKRRERIHMADFYIYASRNLIGEPAIALNGDIALGDGFQLIDVNRMLKDRLLYSLSRYDGSLNCSVRGHKCLNNYHGSHDTHIFALAEPLNETLLIEKLDYPINMNQAENGMIYTMRDLFNFTVTNPCKTLKTYHHHCSAVHGGYEDTYTIYNLGWKAKHVTTGRAIPELLETPNY